MRIVISGATALATLLTPTDASARTAWTAAARVTFSGTVVQSTPAALTVSVRNGRRRNSPRSVTVAPGTAATIRLDGRPALVSWIPPGARVTVTGSTTGPATVLATDVTATR
ncbi:hypothetical protein GCM10010170_027990 [Dactylosporangium salmoneum]|uniref:DUF5666 domain-containing protein n=2 Tax=Dactylosporangium salmoneum TaxID=53361 RepID=A0ABP5T3K3_9ACTN